MDNDSSTRSLTTSTVNKLQGIHISSSTDDDDSDTTKSYYSDSEPESLSSSNFPVQYKLPSRNQSAVGSPVNRTLMDRMAASNKSVRMKHGTTALDIIVPVNRDTSVPSNSGTSQRNTTTPSNSDTSKRNTTAPLTKGKAQPDTITQSNSTPAKNTLPASSLYVPAQWMYPSASSSSSRTVSTSNKPKVPIPPPRSRSSAPPYTAPPPYIEPSRTFHTSRYTKTFQRPIPPYRYPYSSPPYTTQSSSLTYTSRSSSLTYTSKSFNTPNMSQISISSIRSHSSTPSYRPKYPTPIESTPTSKPFYASQSSSITVKSQTFSSSLRSQPSKTPNTSQISKHPKKSQSSTPFYKPRYPTPTESISSSKSFYTSQPSLIFTSRTFKTSNTSQISMHSKRSQSSTPFYKPRYPTPTESISSSKSYYTSQTSTLTNTSQTFNTINTSQTSISSIRSQSSTPSYRPKYPTPIESTPTLVPFNTSQSSAPISTSQSFAPISTSQSSAPISTSQPSSQSHVSRSSAATNNLTSSSIRLTPRSERYRAETTYSHFTFPRSTHYNMPISNTYYTVMPQSSTENSYPLSVCEPKRNVWPTEMGSVVRVSMQNIWSVLATQVQNSLPPSTTVNLQNPSQPSTIKNADKKASLPPVAPCANDQPLLDDDPESSDSKATTSNSSAEKNNHYPVVDLLPLYLHGIEKKDAFEDHIKGELQKAWVYLSKMEVIDIQSIGDIKCICPMLNYEDLLKASLNDKFMLVNMSRQYRVNNLLFETTYDYDNLPNKTIVSENMESKILQWLVINNLEDYYWFFKTLSFFEIQNINPTNVQKFITRSKNNKTIPLIYQLDMCCLLKKIKERPVSLLAILLHLKMNVIDRDLFAKVVIPFLMEILQFPISNEICMLNDVMNQYVTMIWRILLTDIIKFFKGDDTTDTNNTMKDWTKQFSVDHTSTAIEILKRYIPTK